MIERLQLWWRCRTCEHDWRPALTSQGAARWCDQCEKTEALTEPEFYAYFGRIPRI